MRQSQHDSESNDLEAVRARLAHRPLLDEAQEADTAQRVDDATTRYLAGGVWPDRVLGFIAGLLPLICLAAVFAAPRLAGVLVFGGAGVALVLLCLGFTALRSYGALRRSLAASLGLLTPVLLYVAGNLVFTIAHTNAYVYAGVALVWFAFVSLLRHLPSEGRR